jgi:hypothetical protein
MCLPSAFRWCFAYAVVGIGSLAGCRVSDSDQMQAAARQLPYRPLEARIYGSAYTPWLGANAQPGTSAADHKLREIAQRIRSQESEESQARAALWTGDVRYARRLLEKVTSRNTASAAAWSDYSAALHADAADDAFTSATALAAADHALDINPTLPEALFNRALALETMSLREAAVATYTKYLEGDGTSSWASEVRRRIEKLESSVQSAEKSRRAIARVAKSDDELLINDTAIAFPQEARHWGEAQFLGAWGTRVLDNDAAGAALMLKRCRIIGRALETQFGDNFLADTVRAIDRAADPTGLARGHVAYVPAARPHPLRCSRFPGLRARPQAGGHHLRLLRIAGRRPGNACLCAVHGAARSINARLMIPACRARQQSVRH